MSTSRSRLVALALSVLGLLTLGGCGRGIDSAVSPTQKADAATAPQVLQPLAAGQPLPAAELPRLDGDGSLQTATVRGRPALFNFWASWCAFCVEEMPALQAVQRDLGGQVRFVGVDREDELTKARRLAAETGVAYELVVDRDGSFFRAAQGRGMPTTLFVDAQGVIVYRHAGPLTDPELRRLLAERLGVRATS